MKRGLVAIMTCMVLSIGIIGCSENESESAKSTVQTQKNATAVVADIEESRIVTETIMEDKTGKTREELILESEFSEPYCDLHGYWVNDEVSYYFGSFVKDGKVVYFYTKTDAPENWYQYEIKEHEFIADFSVNDQYSSHRVSVLVTDISGNEKEMEFNILTDLYARRKHIDIVDGEEVLNMTRMSDEPSSFADAYKYLNFVDLKVDENGNVTLTPIELADITNNALATTEDGRKAIHYCSENSDGYYSFVHDGFSYVYDGYYVDDNFREEETYYGMSAYPWEYEYVMNPYLIVGNEVFEPIPLSEEILGGYAYRVFEENVLVYNGVEGLYLNAYAYTEGYYYDSAAIIFNSVEENKAITLEFKEEAYYENAMSGKLTYVNGSGNAQLKGRIAGEDYVVYYDEQLKNRDIVICMSKDGFNYRFLLKSEDLANKFVNAVEEMRMIVDAFTLPNGEQTIDEHLRETIDFAGYTFAADVTFEYINRGENSPCGLSSIGGKNFTYVLDKQFNPPSGLIYQTLYDVGYGDAFEVKVGRNETTHEYQRLYAYVPNERSKYINISANADFFEYNKAFSEIEEESRNYLLGKLKRILVQKEETEVVGQN